MGHVLMENRHGLVISPRLTAATGTAEREAAEAMVEGVPGRHRITVGGDKAYDTRGFVQALRGLKAVPHVAQNCQGRKSAIDGRTTRHPGYAVSQRLRKRVEEIFGWMKTVGNLRKTRHRGEDRVGWVFPLPAAAYNLVRIRNLLRRGRGDNGAQSRAGSARYAHFGPWRLDLVQRRLIAPDDRLVMLSSAEYRLLCHFIEQPNIVLGREALLPERRATAAFDRSIDLQISRLRQKLSSVAGGSELILTVRGEGYVLASAVDYS